MLECPKKTIYYFNSPTITGQETSTADIAPDIYNETTLNFTSPSDKLLIEIGENITEYTKLLQDELYVRLYLTPYVILLGFLAIMALLMRTKSDDKQTKSKPTQDYEWVRPLGNIELLFAVGGLYQSIKLNTVQAIWINSKKPISHDQMRDTLLNMTKRIPLLSVSLGRRRLSLWFRKRENVFLDFEKLIGDPMDEYNKLLSASFDMYNGPLWKAKLIEQPSSYDENNTQLYHYTLIFCIQHAITDGATNMFLCKEAVSVLNKMLQGETLPSEYHPIPPAIMDHLPLSRLSLNKLFCLKYSAKKFTRTVIKDYSPKCYFDGAIPRPDYDFSETRVLNTDFSKEMTQKLFKKSKSENVTINSLIVAISSLALFKMAQKRASFNLESANISVTNCINTRRHYEPKDKNALGCHIALSEFESQYTSHDFKFFWEKVKHVNASLKSQLESGEHLKLNPLLPVCCVIYSLNNWKTKNKKNHVTDCHFVLTNMGNLASMLPVGEPTDIVRIDNILRSAKSEGTGQPFTLTCQTFNDKLMISMDYYTPKMREDVANDFFSMLIKNIQNVAEYGTLNVSSE